MKNLKVILYQKHYYEDRENFISLERIKETYKNSGPTEIISNEKYSNITAIYEDGSEETLTIDDLIGLNLIKKTIFDEEYLKEYARLKVEEGKSWLHEFGIHEREENGKKFTCTGYAPTRLLIADEIIKEYKRANEYSWGD